MEYEMVHKSGKRIWVEVRNSFLTDHNGIVNGMIGVTRDISVRKEAQRKIVESEKKYRNLFENGSDLICLHDLEGNLLDTNLHYKDEYGWQKDDLEGLNIREMIPERHRFKFDQYLARILKSGADEGYLKGCTKSGQEVVLEYRNKLILDENGKPQAVQGAARDVTQRIRSEKGLKESEEKYREIVKHAPAGIFELDMAKVKFISVNDVMCEYTGYTKDELLEKDPFSFLSKASRQKAKNLIEQAFSGEKNPPPVEYTIHGKDGQKLTVITNSKFFFENGSPKKAMMVVHDVTQIRKSEEEKRKLEAKLQNVKKL
jgi:PAS domain S-box-containing protein